MKKLAVFLAFFMLVAAGKLSAQVTSPDQPRPQEEVQGWKKIDVPEHIWDFSFPDGGRW